MRIRFHILTAALLLLSVEATGQVVDKAVNGARKAVGFVGDFLDRQQQKFLTKVDTNYITNYEYPWRALLMYNTSDYAIRSYYDEASIRMNTSPTHRITVGLGYQGLGLNFSFKPGKSHQSEGNILIYARRFGLEVKMSTSDRLTFDIKSKTGERLKMDMEDIRFTNIMIDAYWVLNPRRFSYPAALSQSKRQKRSAGSILIGGAINIDAVDLKDTESTEPGEIIGSETVQTLLGAGYGYNWVPGQGRWLVHASLIPMLTLSDKDISFLKDQPAVTERPERFAMTGLGRAGIFYYWSDRFYSGLIIVDRLGATWQDGNPEFANSWYLRVPLIYRF